jgi:hypothetical protein
MNAFIDRHAATKVGVALTLLVASGLLFSSAASAAPPSGLTTAGKTLWNFEALLEDVFHSHEVASTSSPAYALNFNCARNCSPSAKYLYYTFTFAHPAHSAFHLAPRRTFKPGSFGNYPELVRVKGKYVACDSGEHHFLITYGDAAGLSFACLAPSP